VEGGGGSGSGEWRTDGGRIEDGEGGSWGVDGEGGEVGVEAEGGGCWPSGRGRWCWREMLLRNLFVVGTVRRMEGGALQRLN
jgi:hypothetical protein